MPISAIFATMSTSKRLVVIGGGAAGFFCAINAARMNPSLEVILLEKTNKLLSKVKVSGGGRCNVTHACFEIADMIKNYPRGANFLKKSFHRFFTSDTIKWFKERGVELKTEADGRMFPVTDSSQTIIDCLMKEADKYGVQVRIKSEVRGIKIPGRKGMESGEESGEENGEESGEKNRGNSGEESGDENSEDSSEESGEENSQDSGKENSENNGEGNSENSGKERKRVEEEIHRKVNNGKVIDEFVAENSLLNRETGSKKADSANKYKSKESGSGANGPEKFILEFEGGHTIQCDFVCVASGGFPKSDMFSWLQQTGHSIEEPVPSLFTFNMPGNRVRELPGISVPDAQVKVAGSKLLSRGPLLITHWGMSGPAVLRLSAWGAREFAASNYHFTIMVNWLGEAKEQQLQEQFRSLRYELASQKINNRNPFGLPQRLWQYLLEESGISADLRWADLPAKEQNKLIKSCCAQEFRVSGKTTFKEEFVTAGGIKLPEIDPQAMQSKIVPGLFFAGEIMDVDGITGGFNFQHAWTSGYIAAEAIAGLG